MNATKGKILSILVAIAMVAGGAQACQEKNGPSTGTETTMIPPTTAATVDPTETAGTTPEATTTESTAEPTTVPTETTAATTTTQETTVTTAAPTETASGETPVNKTVYATGTINIRSGPSMSYEKVRTVTAGTELTAIAITANNWYRLSDDTYVSNTVVTDIKPTPTPSPTPSPTPDPNATPTPTNSPDQYMSASEATAMVKGIVSSVRAANGLTTHFVSELNTRCYKSAARFVLGHDIPNGTLESAGGIVLTGDMVTWTSGPDYYNSLEEGMQDLAHYLVVYHVPDMATNAEYTEFGVGVAKETFVDPLENERYAYYVYISCTDPEGLAYQIDQGWYD